MSLLTTLDHFIHTNKKMAALLAPFFIFLSSACQAEDSMLKQKPYFTYRIEASGALFESKVNGILLEKNVKGTNMVVEQPVNHYMRTGKNRIGFQLYTRTPGDFGEAKITISLYVNQDEAHESHKKLLSQVTFNAAAFAKNKQATDAIKSSMPAVKMNSTNDFLADENGDVIVHAPQIEQSKVRPTGLHVYQEIELQTPFPLWGFLSADKLDFPDAFAEYVKNIKHYDKTIIDGLYLEHEKVYQLFKNQKLSEILPLFAERNSEMDIAMYLPEGSYEKQLSSALQGDFDNKDSYLKLSDAEFAKPTVSDGKELIRIGSPDMIRFADDENSIYDKYPIWFYKKDGKWIISR
ncbi:hypothetical protein N8878_01525 [Psychromonas sp.]|nr:hypothetical protein [Psychromonas sp.]